MDARFKILTTDLQEFIDINHKWVEFPYLCYDYIIGDEDMDPLEEINIRDCENDNDTSYIYWTCEDVIFSLTMLYLFLIDYSDELEKNVSWERSTMGSPHKTAAKIMNVIEILKQLPVNTMVAPLLLYVG